MMQHSTLINGLSDIDYRFNPNLDADKIQSLGRLEFMDNHENIIIIGPPGESVKV